MGGLVTDSEVVVQRLLHERGLPVPNAWRFVGDSHGEATERSQTSLLICIAGLNICFVQHIVGSECPELDSDFPTRSTVIKDYAAFMIRLSEVHFHAIESPGIGSPIEGGTQVGPLLSMDYFDSGPPYFFGPFESIAERFISHIDYIFL